MKSATTGWGYSPTVVSGEPECFSWNLARLADETPWMLTDASRDWSIKDWMHTVKGRKVGSNNDKREEVLNLPLRKVFGMVHAAATKKDSQILYETLTVGKMINEAMASKEKSSTNFTDCTGLCPSFIIDKTNGTFTYKAARALYNTFKMDLRQTLQQTKPTAATNWGLNALWGTPKESDHQSIVDKLATDWICATVNAFVAGNDTWYSFYTGGQGSAGFPISDTKTISVPAGESYRVETLCDEVEWNERHLRSTALARYIYLVKPQQCSEYVATALDGVYLSHLESTERKREQEREQREQQREWERERERERWPVLRGVRR